MKYLISNIKRQLNYNHLKKNKELDGVIENYLSEPLVSVSNLFSNVDFLVLDFETTGLNPKKDKILSIGYTVIKNSKIDLRQSKHFYCKYTKKIPDASVKIHHITEQKAALGTPIEQIIPELINTLKGKVLVAHYSDIEVNFLQKIVRSLYGIRLPIICVDTLQIAYKEKYRNSIMIEQNALNLFKLREKYNLPRYKAHNALSDAIATAELFLVQVAIKNNGHKVHIKDLL